MSTRRANGPVVLELGAEAADVGEVEGWRAMYRSEMDCQIIHDSFHYRPGWTQEYVLRTGEKGVGYGSIVAAGPWRGRPTVYEYYLEPQSRCRIFDLFNVLLETSGAGWMEVQSNDSLGSAMLHTFARDVTSESILFHDRQTTEFSPPGATFREPTAAENPDVPVEQLRWYGVVEIEGRTAATGGILFHYNPPYGDIFMEVAEPFRRQGIGAFVVQELKRVCYESGYVPGARCNPTNVASRRTLQKAGFVPCGHMLSGRIAE